MTRYERELSNQSYTNKDFGQIYPELLDVAKKISYKWNPAESDESDPGVVLLKLAALIGDKSNYNIDKNILETFPLSVTQLANARQLFAQCGYKMRYYESATTTLSMTMVKGFEPEIKEEDLAIIGPDITMSDLNSSTAVRTYVIPKYTMVADQDNNIVFTTTAEATVTSDGVTAELIPAIQGTINTYSINGDSTVTLQHLDFNNRLYFTELDIPENGVFVEHTSGNLLPQTWKLVDNVVLQPAGTHCYSFGITPNGKSCYIQFPSDVASLIGNGLEVKYVRTKGIQGNIGRNRITQLFGDVTCVRYINNEQDSQSVKVTSYRNGAGNLHITNKFVVDNGKDPETIDDAYRAYEKIKTTFNTLVSCHDYENYLFTNEYASNVVVADRTNDPQSTYEVMDASSSTLTTRIAVHGKSVSQDDGVNTTNVFIPEMNAFDLRVYALTYVDNPQTDDGFNKSFTLIRPVVTDEEKETASMTDYAQWVEIYNDTDAIKSLQHNYREFIPDRPLIFRNEYPLIVKIIPQYRLQPVQQVEVKRAVVSNLYRVLNARAIDFGDEIDYQLVYDTIMQADPRIRAITLDDITYETYALYLDSQTNKIESLRIDTLSTRPNANADFTDRLNRLWKQFRVDIYAKSVLAGKTQLLHPDNNFVLSTSHNEANLVEDVTKVTTNTNIVANPNADSTIIDYATSDLLTNENVVFTAPYLVDDVPYSSYVKFIHNIGTTSHQTHTHVLTEADIAIRANEEYTLKPNEYIVFFWKDSDNDYDPYKYRKYTGGSSVKIISSTFNLMKQRTPNSELNLPVIPTNVLQRLKVESTGTTDEDEYNVVYNGEYKSLTEYVKALSGSEYVLSGSNTLTTKKINSIHINNTTNGSNHICWVLNDSKDGYCTLFDESTDSRTLQAGEYLIYSNDSLTELHILGSGTTITRYKPVITELKINNGSPVYIPDSGRFMFYLDNTSEINLQGTLNGMTPFNQTVNVTIDETYPIQTVSTTVEASSQHVKLFFTLYPKEKLADGKIPVECYLQSHSGTGWRCPLLDYDKFLSDGVEYLSTNNIWSADVYRDNLYATEMEFYQLGPGNKIEFIYDGDASSAEVYDSITINNTGTVVTVNSTEIPLSLHNYRIVYIDSEAVRTSLPKRASLDTCWKAYSILNLNSTSTKPQFVRSHHTLKFYSADNNNPVYELTDKETYLLTSRDIAVMGGIKMDVTTLDVVSGDVIPLDVYTYSVSEAQPNWVFLDTAAQLTINSSTSAQSFNVQFKVPAGNYIIPITLSDNLDSLLMKQGATVLKTPGDSSSYRTKGRHYIMFTASGNAGSISTVTLTIQCTNTSEGTCTLFLDKLFKYVVPNIEVNDKGYEYNIEHMTMQDIAKRVDELNLATSDAQFDYTYVVPEDKHIENPLHAKSFIDSNHIYNKFTICKWNASNNLNKLVVASNIK